MGNCLHRNEPAVQDYSLLNSQQDRDHRPMGNIQESPSGSRGQSLASSSTSSGASSAATRSNRDRRESPLQGSGSNYTTLVERDVPPEEDLAKLAQRFGLIQHLPTGLYDGGKKDREEDRFRVVELAYRLAHQEGAKRYLVAGGSCSSGSETLKELCPICMIELNCGDPVRFLPCMHVYHKDCIDDWLLKHSLTCPNCMEPVDSALLNSYEVGKTPWNFE